MIASAGAEDGLVVHYKIKAGKLRPKFFATPEEFSVRTIGVPSVGAVEVCFGAVITFPGP